MTKPAVVTWANGGSANLPAGGVPSAIRSTGFTAGSIARADYVNQLGNDLAAWIAFLDPFFTGDELFVTGRITGSGDSGTSAGLYVTTSSGKVWVKPASNGDILLETVGTGKLDIQTPVSTTSTWNIGTFAGAGPTPSDLNLNVYGTMNLLPWNGLNINGRVTLSSTLGLAWDVAQTFAIHASPAQGGYQQVDGTAFVPMSIDADNVWYMSATAPTAAQTWRCPVVLRGRSVSIYTLTQMRINAKAPNNATSLTISLKQLTSPGSTPTIKTIATWTTTGATLLLGSDENATIVTTGSGGTDGVMDTTAAYWIEVTMDLQSASDNTSTGIQTIRLTISHTAIE